MIIKNRPELATSKLRGQALDIIEAGIERVLPSTVMRTAVSFDAAAKTLFINKDKFDVKGRIFVIGAGKASGLMAQTLESIIGPANIQAGIAVEKAPPAKFNLKKIKIMQAGHPVPDERGIAAGNAIFDLKPKYSPGKDDLVICLISGGGSALLPCPAEGLTLDDKQKVTRFLLSCGADIYEINMVRKHLSGIKGGRLADYFAPARVLSLILSDVVGNVMSIIASGPTYPDTCTFADAYKVLEKYDLLHKVPANVRSRLERGCRGQLEETPKSLENAGYYIIGDNRLALEAMAAKADKLGFNPVIVTAEQTGDTEFAARQRAAEILAGGYQPHTAVILGGETTPVLPEHPGKGGRNQHYAALTMLLLEKLPGNWVAASVATDGSDYLADVAGAIVDKSSLDNLQKKRLDIQFYLDKFDSYPLLIQAGNSIVITGSTGTNVGDVVLYLLPSP
jgi:glycerate 2-kinase